MELVSNFLDNILVVEQPQSTNLHEEQEPGSKRPSVLSKNDEDNESLVSNYWYLEDDSKKVSNQLADRLMEKVLSVIIDSELGTPQASGARVEMQKQRPALSVNLMSKNSTQLAQKASPIFEAMDAFAMMMSWCNPFFTVGSLMLATHVILNPYLATTAPSIVLLHKFLIPSYLKLYPPDRSLLDGKFFQYNPVPYDGPPLDKYEPPRPISQFSREFVMNYTDMQNQMVPYIRLYGALVDRGQHYFLFENQKLSSVVYLILVVIIFLNVTVLPILVPLAMKYLPLRAIAIVWVWGAVGAFHPVVKDKALDYVDTEEARLARLDKTDHAESFLMRFVEEDLPTEAVREVEIFELHRLKNKVWEPVGYSSDFFTLNHPRRILHSPEDYVVEDVEDEDEHVDDEHVDVPILCKATLADVKLPVDWVFTDAKWTIDLDLGWANYNCIMDLVNIDTDEKWVYDVVTSSLDGVYRRRRWTRQCKRETVAKRIESLGKTPAPQVSPNRNRKSFTLLT